MAQMTMTIEKGIETDVVSLGGVKRAYVTFLAGNKDYWMGVVGLAKGLRKVKSAYPLVVATLPDVPEEHRQILVAQGCIIRDIKPVYPPENETGYSMAYYVINYSKLRIWEFVEYEKMIYLDGDIQVFSNIDHLFDTPRGYFLGAPPPVYFNAGMLVFEPNLVTYEDLLRVVRITTPTYFAEQDFLNVYFRDIYKPIPSTYNLVMAMLWRHPEHIDLDQISVVHYCANGSKPWKFDEAEEHMDRDDIQMLVKKWWEIYEDSSLDYKNFVETESKLNPVTATLASKESVGDALTSLAPSAA
ncbi:Nucleotide-diphospho-sugar transferase [Arabidopsis thaliana x Arabidopsis arenosa]|uniref:Hexosyltransferase n=1 Tax=Arabidopsis thaliana x Arabidopsis arenosa TaxID=1240361 RepID=A0A8T1YYX2_9BRAS|nr:Nucleotide-diphospho-sugar transferase [Arabidopsis thaliana x Arabidopsis arenosa]